jgi:hypothetical protein
MVIVARFDSSPAPFSIRETTRRDDMASITYAKLKDGSWGIRADGTALTVGQIVTVTKKSGETKSETVARVLWTGDGITLAAIVPSTPTPSSSANTTRAASSPGRSRKTGGNGLGPRTGCSCGSQQYGSKPTDCRSCQFDQDDN